MKFGSWEIKMLRINTSINCEAGASHNVVQSSCSAIIIAIFLISNVFAAELPKADFPIEDLILDFGSVNKTEKSNNNNFTNLINKAKDQFSELESQWDILCADSNKFDVILAENIKGFEIISELTKRIENTNDPLDKLEKYEPIFFLGSSYAHQIYAEAYGMVWNNDEIRAAKLFEFLINTNNPNGFTVGNSHYWLAHHLYYEKNDLTNALNHYLLVHTFPACLVFTDASYYEAAEIYLEFGKTNTAIALYSIQIPYIDYWEKEFYKAEKTINIFLQQNDIKNAVHQILRSKRVKKCKPEIWDRTYRMYWVFNYYNIDSNTAEINRLLKKVFIPEKYEIDCIRQVLSNEKKEKVNPLLVEMLLHAWPPIEEVDEEILTNRILSNNVFKKKRRTNIKVYR